tara:strand:+ start:2681 stop:3199 length:519 start_codon:yes stop_codon:yes gene_type:complete
MAVYQLGTAQNIGVEKSVYSIQTGFLGVWFNQESRLSPAVVLRSEVGFDGGIRGGDVIGKTIIGLTPVIALEPRWYYNISKREVNGKIIKNNSSNFLAVGIKYHPDWFVIGNSNNISIDEQISVIPKWGIRRSIAQSSFNYEIGLGIGKRYYTALKEWETTADLHLRIGYSF